MSTNLVLTRSLVQQTPVYHLELRSHYSKFIQELTPPITYYSDLALLQPWIPLRQVGIGCTMRTVSRPRSRAVTSAVPHTPYKDGSLPATPFAANQHVPAYPHPLYR